MAAIADADHRTGGRSFPQRLHGDLLSSVFRVSRDGIVDMGGHLVVRAANDTAAAQSCLPLERLLGRGLLRALARWPRLEPLDGHAREGGELPRSEVFPIDDLHPPQRGATRWDAGILPVYRSDGSARAAGFAPGGGQQGGGA